jgi:hypothetical protein
MDAVMAQWPIDMSSLTAAAARISDITSSTRCSAIDLQPLVRADIHRVGAKAHGELRECRNGTDRRSAAPLPR